MYWLWKGLGLLAVLWTTVLMALLMELVGRDNFMAGVVCGAGLVFVLTYVAE